MARTRTQPKATSDPEAGLLDRDDVFYVDPKTVHPDPHQPRLFPDDELQADIERQGILQAAIVRPHPDPDHLNEWMIVDGERRWRGAIAAGQTTFPVKIRYDLEDRGERLLVQLSANKGKPLTPLEEALAWKDVMEEMHWSQAQFAKETGNPRSTVGDRMRILDLDQAWIDLLKAGTIQVSHVPFLHKYIAIPSKHQQEFAAKVPTECRLAHLFLEKGDPIPIGEFESVMRPYFEKCLRPLPTGKKGERIFPEWPKNAEPYEGPTLKLKDSYGGELYAADPDIWRPIVRRAQAQRIAKEKKARKDGKSTPATPSYLQLPPGYKKVTSTDNYNAKPPKGWTEIVDRNGRWNMSRYYGGGAPFDVDVFLEHVDPEKLAVFERGSYKGVGVATNDDAAYGLAREAWLKRWAARRSELVDEQRRSVGDGRGPAADVSGPGARYLLRAFLGSAGRGDFDVEEDNIHAILDAGEIAGLAPCAGREQLNGLARRALAWFDGLLDEEIEVLAGTYARCIALKLDTVSSCIEHEQAKAIEAYARRAVRWSAIGRPASQAATTEITEADLPDSADEELEPWEDEDPDSDRQEWDDPEGAELAEEAIDA